ncbi:MAG: leucine-rich repeat protein, partial [Lachnospiraceae bacterium]|nr:leucine-rich repeat protein [Lachnospiraceae bacterium]
MLDNFIIEDGILKAYVGPDPEILIPEGVHTIGDGVFKGMSWILKVTLPSTLKKIGAFAFKGCRKLQNMDFPEGLSEVGEYAFHRCHDIEEMIFPKNMTNVGSHAFLYCDGLKKVVMEGPLSLGKAVFSHNMALQEISLNKDLDYHNFGDEVFEGCVCLHRIILSGEAYEISNLIEAIDPASGYPDIIRSIAAGVYHSLQIEGGILRTFNINLKNVTIPEGITTIGKGCFFDKKGIESIIFPKSLRRIMANAFLNCTSLTEITLQNEDLLPDGRAFRGCTNLKKVHLSDKTYLLEDETSNELVGRIREQVRADFLISGKTLIRYVGDEEQISIPKEVEIIGERAFFGKERLKIVTCPDILTEIREQAFAGCLTLQNVILPAGLKRIEREAFAECKKLSKCNLPMSLEYIGEYAFRRCMALPVIDQWPEDAVIHPYAFYRTKNYSGQARVQEHIHTSFTFDIAPYEYANKTYDRKLILSGIGRVGKYAFSACRGLEEVVIDSPACVIEREAFSCCPDLKKVRLNIREMEKGVFAYCRNLEEVCLSGISILPAECFAGCHNLQSFEAKELTQMDARCFDECIHLNSFDFSGIKVIGERAFERCDSLRSAELGCVVCGFHAFADCSGLEYVNISPETVLKSGAFIGCTQIGTVEFEGRKYEFSSFADGLNHVGNPFPMPVREVISSVYSCFGIPDGKTLNAYTQDAVRITVPRDIEELGQDVFRDHVRLEEIDIPASVKIFGSHAFSMTKWLDRQREMSDMVIVNRVLLDGAGCKGKVVLPESLDRVASWSFAGNTEITELVIPSERIAIEALSFRNCLNLKKITAWNGKEYVLRSVEDLEKADYPELIERIFSECINCFKLEGDGNLVESTGNIRNLTFPDGIRAIGDNVYMDCHLLEDIALSKDTQKIGKSAFESSKWLKEVTNAGSVVSIGPMAFSGCQSLESIDL